MQGLGRTQRVAFAALTMLGLGTTAISGEAAATSSPPIRTALGLSPAGVDVGGEHGVEAIHVFSPDQAWFVGEHGSGYHAPTFRQWDGAEWRHAELVKTRHAELSGVDGLSPDDAWIVGDFRPKLAAEYQSLAEHWDGSAWKRTPTPDPIRHYFGAVAEIEPDDVWAVGTRSTTDHVLLTLAEHWDGSSWTITPTPSIQGEDWSTLYGITAVGHDDVWALAHTSVTSFAEHWNGRRWSIVSLPNPSDELYAIAASSPSDVWIVGRNPYGPVVDHWDGSSWTAQNVAPRGDARFNDVLAIGADDVWAVGGQNGSRQTLTEHWDGSAWSIVASPNPGASLNELDVVGASASNDVWAVGLASNGDDSYHRRYLYLHWDGTGWTHIQNH